MMIELLLCIAVFSLMGYGIRGFYTSFKENKSVFITNRDFRDGNRNTVLCEQDKDYWNNYWQIGDDVTCLCKGHGKIANKNNEILMVVDFDDGQSCTYYINGTVDNYSYKTLFKRGQFVVFDLQTPL